MLTYLCHCWVIVVFLRFYLSNVLWGDLECQERRHINQIYYYHYYCALSHRLSPDHKCLNILINICSLTLVVKLRDGFFGFRDEVNWKKVRIVKVFPLTPTLICLFLWVAWVRTGAITSLQSSLSFMMLFTYIGYTTGSMSGDCLLLPVATSPFTLLLCQKNKTWHHTIFLQWQHWHSRLTDHRDTLYDQQRSASQHKRRIRKTEY